MDQSNHTTMGHKLKISGNTDKGKKRSKNEDSFLVEPELGFMIVADGMGGHAAGDVASKLAVELCSQQLKRALHTGRAEVDHHIAPNADLDPRTVILGDCVKFSNQAVFEAGQSNPANHNMGTTVVAALWLDNKLAVANVGDSRLYIILEGRIRQCTRDHSFVQDQINRGMLTPEEAEKSDMRNMLTRSVGVGEDVEVDLSEVEVAPGDYILLCSDGLTKMLDDEQILAVFQNETDPKKISDELISRANAAGGGDNITTIVAKVEPAAGPSLGERVKGVLKKMTEEN